MGVDGVVVVGGGGARRPRRRDAGVGGAEPGQAHPRPGGPLRKGIGLRPNNRTRRRMERAKKKKGNKRITTPRISANERRPKNPSCWRRATACTHPAQRSFIFVCSCFVFFFVFVFFTVHPPRRSSSARQHRIVSKLTVCFRRYLLPPPLPRR